MVQIPNFRIIPPNYQQSFAGALNMANALQARDLRQQQMDFAKQKYADQQRQVQQYHVDMGRLAMDPSPENIISTAAKYPKQAEALSKLSEMTDRNSRRRGFEIARDAYMASKSGRTDIAKQIFDDNYEAAINSGDERSAKMYEVLALGSEDPNQTMFTAGMYLNSTKEGRDWLDQQRKLDEEERAKDLHPLSIKEKKLDMMLEKMEASRAKKKTDAEVRKIESEIAKAEREKGKLFRTRKKEAYEIAEETDSMLDSVDMALRIADDPQYGGISTVADAATGFFGSRVAVDKDVKDFKNLIDEIKSKAFLVKSPSIKGPLTDKDVLELQRSFANLDLSGSPDAVLKGLRRIKERFQFIRGLLTEYYGMDIPNFRREVIERDQNLQPTSEGSIDVGSTLGGVMGSDGRLKYTPDELDRLVNQILQPGN